MKNTGYRLYEWYREPEMVEYLFELGQTALIGIPGSEDGNSPWYLSHELKNEGFWLGDTERKIFSRIAFIDYGYFYDLDNQWYYIVPGPFRIKIPLGYLIENVERDKYEFDYINQVEKNLITHIFTDFIKKDRAFEELVKTKNIPTEVYKVLSLSDNPIYDLFRKYKYIYEYFDDWIVVEPNENGYNFKIRKKEETHTETFYW
ncbi:MAG: hypothetical protein IJ062_11280 [Firmicutes bacterium]|nr:hypothetical protein [Bacillota bacterium]